MARVETAAALVNALATSHAGGRAVAPPSDRDELRARAERVLQTDVSATEAEALRRLATRLRDVFAALDDGRPDDAAEALNLLLAGSGARPHLQREAPGQWHLHFHGPDAGLVQGWTAGCATGLAYVLGSADVARLGICAAPACERVFLDTSRNGSRRFCSTPCQHRVKAAAYRARRRRTGP
jgi:predicted RNA-binding Zn ribbon-like protein